MTNGVDFVKLQADVAVILQVCENIREDIAEVKSVTKDHNVRIRTLEVGQGEIRTEMRVKGAIAVGISAIISYFAKIFE